MFKKVIGKRVMCLYPWKADAEIKTSGGIIVPDAQKDKPNNLVVTMSGIEDIEPGDRVVFNRYHGTTIEIDKQEFLFLKEEEILGVIDGAHFKDDSHNHRFSSAP